MSQSPARSPARAALYEHLEQLRAANNAVAAAQQPFQRAADQVEHAEKLLRNAEAALAAIDATEADKITKTWPPSPPTAKAKEARANAEETVAHARRVLGVAQTNMEAARGQADQAAIAARNLAAETDSFVNCVLAEEGMTAVAHLAAVRAAVVKAADAVDAVRHVLAGRQAYREAEAISFAANDARWPHSKIDPSPYVDLAERLHESADAVVV